jgi:hypothetical protein
MPAPRSGLFVAALAVIVIGIGAYFRLTGLFTLEIWGDEALWGARVSEGVYGWIRPIAFMAITQALVSIDNNEVTMRALSIVPGLVQLPLLYVLLRRVLRTPLLAVAGTWLLAINLVAVAMTKEFKPYALESTYHTALVLVTMVALEKRTRASLLVFLAMALGGIWFAWSCVFAFPAAFSVLLWDRVRRGDRTEALLLLGGGVATLAELAAVFLLRVSSNVRDTEYWGNRYDVFYTGDGSRLGWILDKTADIATFPSRTVPAYRDLIAPVEHGFQVLCVIGIVALIVTRRWQLLALLVGPWAFALAFNVAGEWPYGLFRTNVFLIFYTITLAAVAADAIWQRAARAHVAVRIAAIALGVALIVVTVPRDVAQYARKGAGTLMTEYQMKRALRKLMEHELAWPTRIDDRKVPLLLGGRGCSVVRYYLYWNTEGRTTLRPWFDENVEIVCTPDHDKASWDELLRSVGGRPFWALSGKRGYDRVTRRVFADRCDERFAFTWYAATHLALCDPIDGREDGPLEGEPLSPSTHGQRGGADGGAP